MFLLMGHKASSFLSEREREREREQLFYREHRSSNILRKHPFRKKKKY